MVRVRVQPSSLHTLDLGVEHGGGGERGGVGVRVRPSPLHTHIHTYIHTCMHTYTYMHTYIDTLTTPSPRRLPTAKPRGTAGRRVLFPDWQGLSYVDPPSYSRKVGLS